MLGMGKKEVVTITDDIDDRAGAETVSFAYAGRSYEIDLGKKNQAKLEKALEPFIAAARKVGSQAAPRTHPPRHRPGPHRRHRGGERPANHPGTQRLTTPEITRCDRHRYTTSADLTRSGDGIGRPAEV